MRGFRKGGRVNNRSGFKGVYQDHGRWAASIWIKNKVHLGNFGTPEEAFVAYSFAARKHFGPSARVASGRGKLLIDIALACLERVGTTCPRTHHGLKKHHLYWKWKAMRQRCSRQSHRAYQYYGERGITVCERWNDIRNYVADIEALGPRPSPKHSIDRIDNEGNYEPGNVRWATPHQASR
jgi:hypothetical protein